LQNDKLCATIRSITNKQGAVINMKRGSTIFLRGVVLLLGAIVLALCAFALPIGIKNDEAGYYRPILLGLYVPAIPFFGALYQTLKLLGYIDKNQAFCFGGDCRLCGCATKTAWRRSGD
jgi:hypothetical protein